MASTMEIDSADVVRMMLQFMKENNLQDSWKALSTETEVSLNTVDNVDVFVADIQNGRWDAVLAQVNNMNLPKEKFYMLYEQVIIELLELGERELAKEILRTTEPMIQLKADNLERFLKLEQMCKRPYFNAADAYPMGSTKERQRQEIADALVSEIVTVAPSRLLVLLGQALKYQQSQGQLPKTASGEATFDLFRGSKKSGRKEVDDKYPKKMFGQIRFSAESHPETGAFSPDGQSLVTGSIDGFIEVWDTDSCKLRKDLEYQNKDELMMHEEAVLCSSFSRDGELLATGSQAGRVKIWRLSTGACLRKFQQAHPQGVTCIQFSRDGTQVLTSSYDMTCRIHGLKSGKTIKEFRGHTAYVNCATFMKDGNTLMSGSSDGSVKVWDAKTTECMLSFRPAVSAASGLSRDFTVHTIIVMPNNADQIFVCCREPMALICNSHGQVLKTFNSGKATGGDFVCACVSPQGKWIYCAGEDGWLYIFEVATGQLESVLQLSEDREIIGILHHPQRNILSSMTDDGQLKLWRP